ncbi:MAG: tetratricopeptide (TPR) repeat protein [Planctomycetaceae bacterium]|jgi:tetratricopeptide (TPR) repeat protein
MSESNRSGRALVLTLLVLAIVGVLGSYYLTRPVDPIVQLRQRIDQTILAGNPQGAIVMLRQLSEIQPENYAVHKVIADTSRDIAQQTNPNAGDTPEGIRHLIEASRIRPDNVGVLRRLYDYFLITDQERNAGEAAMRLVKLGNTDTDMIAQAVRHAIVIKDKDFISTQADGVPGDSLQADILNLAVRIEQEGELAEDETFWEADRLVNRLLNTASIRLQALDKFYFRYVGIIFETTVRHAHSGAEADRRLLQAFSVISRLAISDAGRANRVEVVEMAARPISAALRSRVREGRDLHTPSGERTDVEARRKSLQQFVDLAEPIFKMGTASPFVYEQLSRVALELENDKLAIQMLQRGFQLHAKMAPRRQNELMSVHAQSALRLIGRGQFEPLRDDIAELRRNEHTAHLGELMNGLLAFQQGRFDDAHDSLAAIPKDSPHAVPASGLLVRVLLLQNRWEEALDLISAVDRLWPTLPEVTRHWLAEAAGSRDRLKLLKVCCMLRLGQVQPAIEVLSYLDKSSLRAKSRLIRLIELMRSGKSKRSWEVLREARKDDPHDFDLLLGEFGMLLRDGATDGAVRALATFVQQHPDQPHAGIAYVEWLISQEETAAALTAMRNVRATAPDKLLVWLLSADLLMTEQRTTEIGHLVAEMQQRESAVAHIPVVHAYSVFRNEGLDEAAAAMLESSFEAHHSNGYTTTAAMVSLAKGDGDFAYKQFASAFNLSTTAARDRERLLDKIGEAFADIDPAAISTHIDRVLVDFPAEPALLIAAVELALRKGAFETATSKLDKLQAVDAVPGRAGFMRARLLSASGLPNRALEELEEVFKIAPRHSRAHLMAARLEYANREYARALVELRQVPFPLSDGEEASLLLGQTLSHLNRDDEAVTNLTKRVQRDPQRVKPWLVLSQAYASQNRINEARAVLEQALQFHGKDRGLQDALLTIHLEQKNSETAATLAQTFAGTSPDLPTSMRLAKLFLENGEPEIAYKWISRAHMVPNAESNNDLVFLDALLLHERGMKNQRWEMLQAARRRYETLLQREPGHIAALNGLARLLMRDMRTAAEGVAVVEQIRTAMPLARLKPEVQATVSEAYRRAGRPTEALTVIKRSINQNPDAAVLRLEFAAALIESFPEDPVKARQAKQELERAAELRLPANRLSEFNELSARLENS